MFSFFVEISAQNHSISKGEQKVLTVTCGNCVKVLYMPKPEYPEIARATGVRGQVEIGILVDETGSVISASLISGHIFFHKASLDAAYKAKFEPLLLSGKPARVHTRVVYNFVKEPDSDVGEVTSNDTVDDESEILPGSIKVSRCYECEDLMIKPPDVAYPDYVGYGPQEYKGEVGVQITIGEEGNVESAKGISGNMYFRPMLEKASLSAKFKPTFVDGKSVKKTAVIFYKITPPGKETELTPTPRHHQRQGDQPPETRIYKRNGKFVCKRKS